MKTADLYNQVTATIVADLEKGVAPWLKPGKTGKGTGLLPVNVATKRTYNGINVPILWHAVESKGYALRP